jgi:small subunit ribosomal protein S2
MPSVSMRQLLEAGVHFGHQTRRWNPKMRTYIFAERNGIHIIDLAQTVKGLDEALAAVREIVARGETILFVGTKKQAQEPISAEAARAGMPYVNQRWLGGMLTNFVTIKKRIGLLDQLEARRDSGEFERLPKKEAARLTDELNKLDHTLGGIRRMRRLPGAIFVIDPHREKIAVTEAIKLEIPVVGTGDTNVDPDDLTYVIPANDDAIRSIRLLCQLVADACLEGTAERATRVSEPELEDEEDQEIAAATAFEEQAADDLLAAIASGGVASFDPELDEDDLLPGARAARAARTTGRSVVEEPEAVEGEEGAIDAIAVGPGPEPVAAADPDATADPNATAESAPEAAAEARPDGTDGPAAEASDTKPEEAAEPATEA